MRVLLALINFEVVAQDGVAESVLGEHASNCLLDDALGTGGLLEEIFCDFDLLAARIERVVNVLFLSPFVSCQSDLDRKSVV